MLLRPPDIGAAETPSPTFWCCWDPHILVLLRPPHSDAAETLHILVLVRPPHSGAAETPTFWYCWDRQLPFKKIQHGGDWEWSRTQGPKNFHNILLTVRPLSWAYGHWKMLLILKKLFSTWLLSSIFRFDSPKKCPTNLYAVNLWLKSVSATGATETPTSLCCSHPLAYMLLRPLMCCWGLFISHLYSRVSLVLTLPGQ